MIRILADTSTLYSVEEGKRNNIDISPLSVTINDKTYEEYEEIKPKEFIEIINEGHVPTSSQPSIGKVLELYNKYKDDEIINITMADGLSGTYQSACGAKNICENPDNVTVINSRTLCGPHRYLVDLAVKLASLEYTKQEIIEIIEEEIKTTQSFLIPHDFDFLVRGGRLSFLSGKIGAMIGLVPVVMASEDGQRLESFTKTRSYKKAVIKICDYLNERNIDDSYIIYVAHALNEKLAKEAENIIKERINGAEVIIKELSPAFITQGGPSCVAIQYIKKFNI